MLNPPLSDGEGKPPKVARGWGFKFENSTSAESRQVKIQNSKFRYPLHVFQNHLLCVNHAVRAMHNAVSNTPLRKPVRGCDDKASM